MGTHSRSRWKLPSWGALARLRRAASYFSTRLCIDTPVTTRRESRTPTWLNLMSTLRVPHWYHAARA